MYAIRSYYALGLDAEVMPQEQALRAFAVGLVLCAASVVVAPTRSLRWLSSAQGLMHAWCALVAEVQAVDVIVLGVPMYNFGVPVQLKTWIDAT